MKRHLGIYSGKSIPGSYCVAEVKVAGRTLYIDGNSKITGANGSYEQPSPNAFSLPHVATCPGSTPTCRSSCYVHGLEENAKDLHRLYSLNQAALLDLLDEDFASSAEALGAWINEHARQGFRWHVSGDVMNRLHAAWINAVALQSLKVQHWIYTRTYWYVYELDAPNLTVNLSADRDNYERVKLLPYRLCYLATEGEKPPADLPEGSVVFPDYANRGRNLPDPREHSWWQGLSSAHRRMICPADFFGQSEEYRCGPCRKCLN